METVGLKDVLNFGFAGAVCLWFLTRTDKRLDNLTAKVVRLIRAIATLAESPHFDEATKRQVRRILDDEDEEKE